jgi:integrase
VIPLDLQPHYGRKEIVQALGTADPGEAKKRHAKAWVVLDIEFDAMRAAHAGQPATPEPDEAPTPVAQISPTVVSWVNLDRLREERDEAVRTGDLPAFMRQQREALAVVQAMLDGEVSPTKDLRELEGLRNGLKAFLSGDGALGIAAARAARSAAPEVQSKASGGRAVKLMTLFDKYVGERQPAPATVKRWRPVMDDLIAFLGHDDATQITKANVVAWKEALLAEKKPDGTPARIARTVKETYLAALKVVLEFGRENGPLIENAAADVKVRTPKKIRLRNPGFTDDEAVTILRATMLPHPESLAPTHQLARRWVPWLCAYTGARVGEMSQLRTEDVNQIDGVWTVRITPDAGGVKSGKFRVVPLHAHLIEQGFVEVATKANGPLFYNPARGRGGTDANPHHKKIGERLGAWVRKIGVDDPNVQPNHGWRHRFETEMRRARLDYEARHVLVGHAHQTESGTYGEWDAASLKREIDKLPTLEIG